MKTRHLALPLLPGLVLAQDYSASSGPGAGPDNGVGDLENANHAPNATGNFDFHPIHALGIYNEYNDWNWHINITEVDVSSPTSSDAKVLNTVYSLSWPGNSTTSSAIDQAFNDVIDSFNEDILSITNQLPRFNGSFCATIFNTPFTDEVTNAWRESEGQETPCVGFLTSDCRSAIQEAWYEGEQHDNGCYGPPADLEGLEECQGIFPANEDFTTTNLAPENGTALTNNTAFAYRSTAEYDASSANTVLEDEKQRLHMVLLEYPAQERIDVLCARVEKPRRRNSSDVAGGEDVEESATNGLRAQTLMISFAILAVVAITS